MRFVFKTLSYGIRNVTNFKGRDRRRTFWSLGLAWLVCFLAIYSMIWEFGFQYMSENMPDEDPTLREFLPYWYSMFGIIVFVYAFMFGPLVSAAVRRLNDTGVGARPLKQFGIFAGVLWSFFVLFPLLMLVIPEAQTGDTLSWWTALVLVAIILSLVVLMLWSSYLKVYLLIQFFKKSDPQPNRFGPPPAA